MTPSRVEQVFLQRKGGVTEVLLVLEDEAGGRTRERLPFTNVDLAATVTAVGRQLAARGIGPARRTRLRVERGDELHDDPALLERFLAELREE